LAILAFLQGIAMHVRNLDLTDQEYAQAQGVLGTKTIWGYLSSHMEKSGEIAVPTPREYRQRA
jgi:hypothetical protein